MFAYCKLFQTSDSYYIQFTVVPKPKTSRLFAHLARRPTRSPAFIFWRRLSLFFNPCRALLLTFSRVFEEPKYDGTVTVTTLCKFQADRPKHEWIVKKCDPHVPVSSWTFVVSPDKTKTTTTTTTTTPSACGFSLKFVFTHLTTSLLSHACRLFIKFAIIS